MGEEELSNSPDGVALTSNASSPTAGSSHQAGMVPPMEEGDRDTSMSQYLPPPPGFGKQLSATMRQSLHELLVDASGQLGAAYRARAEHPTDSLTELLQYTNAANPGALSNRLAVVNAVMNEQMPGGPSVARQAASSVRTLLRRTSDQDAKAHLTTVIEGLEQVAGDPGAAQAEQSELVAKSAALEAESAARLNEAAGVYVYTYPHYWRYPHVPGTERRLLKVGRTDARAWQRVRSQARSTGAPEDPLLLRVYTADDPAGSERTFHRLLDAAEHERSVGFAVGREWFSTTIDFCDEIARALGLEILAGDEPVL